MFYYSKTLLFEVPEGLGWRRLGDLFRAWVSGGAFSTFYRFLASWGRFWSPEGTPWPAVWSINGAFVGSCLQGRFQVPKMLTLGCLLGDFGECLCVYF